MIRTLTLALTVSGALASSAMAQEVTLRFQHFVSPETAGPTYFMQPWADKIEAESNGRIKIQLSPFMQLGGSAANQYDLIRDGAIDGGWIIPGYQPGRFPEAEALELPFMTPKSGEVASLAAWRFTEAHLMDDFSDIHVITTHMHGPGLVHKTGAPITVVDDFDGLKLRGPSRPATLLLERLGAEPIGMPVPAFPEALARGVLDGGVITWEMSPSLKLDELVDSHTDVAGDQAFYNLFFVWGMNKDVYDGLPEDLRAIIDANSGEMAAILAGRAYDIGDAKGREIMAAANEIAEMPEDTTAEVKALGVEVEAAWIKEMSARGIDGTSLVADAHRLMSEAVAETAVD